MASAVYVRKKKGEIRLCVDYRELSKWTHKDTYPLPLIDEVQDRLSGDTVFTKLDWHSGYWQVPVNQEDPLEYIPKADEHCNEGATVRDHLPGRCTHSLP